MPLRMGWVMFKSTTLNEVFAQFSFKVSTTVLVSPFQTFMVLLKTVSKYLSSGQYLNKTFTMATCVGGGMNNVV